MTHLAFRLPPDVPETAIDIYDASLGLVARFLSSSSRAELTPGRYHAIARPPEEPSLQATFDVTGDRTLVELRSSSARSPRPPANVLVLHDDAGEAGKLPWSTSGSTSRESWYLLGREMAWALPSAPHTAPDRWVDLRLSTHEETAQCCVLPVGAWQYLQPAVSVRSNGSVSLAMRLRHGTARYLLAYVTAGLFAQASVLLTSRTLDTVQLLFGEDADPVAASANAFTLITLGELGRLRGWTEDLRHRHTWLPDALVADAEHLGRLGHHKQAAEALAELQWRGLPCLTVALTTAISRIRNYVDAGLGGPQLPELLADLTRYAIACDLTAAVTTFTAESPWQPLPRTAPMHPDQRGP